MEKVDAKITIEAALQQFKNGKMLIVVDGEDRENEGDFVKIGRASCRERV